MSTMDSNAQHAHSPRAGRRERRRKQTWLRGVQVDQTPMDLGARHHIHIVVNLVVVVVTAVAAAVVVSVRQS